MKKLTLSLALVTALVLGGCSLFEAEVTRPVEPAPTETVVEAPTAAPTTEPPTTAPTTEPTTAPSTEPPTTIPVEEYLTESKIMGTWSLDAEYTLQKSGVSPRDLYGSAISYGAGMTFSGDGTFSYYAGSCYGEGRFTMNGKELRVTLSKGDPDLENNVLLVDEGDVLRIGLDQYGDGTIIWWTKNA